MGHEAPVFRMIIQHLPKVLVVDDEPDMRAFVIEALSASAAQAMSVSTAPEALTAIESRDFDIVISDICMPGVPGLELLKLAQQSRWDLAIILMTGRPQICDLIDCVRFRAADFLPKPFTIQQLTNTVARTYAELSNQRQARRRSEALDLAMETRTRELETALYGMEESYRSCLEVLIATLDAREHETYAHSFRVQAYASHLAKVSGYTPAFIPQLETAALLHDIGKIAVPDRILLKPGKLTSEEFEQMKRHAQAGADILERIHHLRPATDIVRHHHERYDGTGYPCGLTGDQIPLGSRVFTIADTLDAITSDRCYRRASPYSAAYQEIVRCSGTQFDPRLVDAFCRVPERVWVALRLHAERRRSPRPSSCDEGFPNLTASQLTFLPDQQGEMAFAGTTLQQRHILLPPVLATESRTYK